ncbi:MAG: NUDIX domain-containing protein [Candidatus Accumulibacter necessarius]|jgi:8-oxo-dGTP diphosphatase|uniref:NUDIX domain-containing protein n=1 Tax=Candidatus Accumulibacter necessarius TaxID=2954386 RepID=UPI002FC33E6F
MKKGVDYIGVGVGAVIVNDERILLLLRKKAPEQGCWSIPGGGVEYGETIESAILREIDEELGIKGEIISLLRVTNHIGENNAFHWVSPAFLVHVKSGTPQNIEPDSHKGMGWFPINDLPENLTITTKAAVNSYVEYRISKR